MTIRRYFLLLCAGWLLESAGTEAGPEPALPREFRGHTEAVGSLAFLADGKTLLSSADDGVRWWDVASGKQIRHVKKAVFAHLFPAPGEDFHHLAALGQADLPTPFPPAGPLQLLPGGRFALFDDPGCPYLPVLDLERTAEVLSITPGENPMRLPRYAISANGDTLAAWNQNHSRFCLRVLDLDSGQEKRMFRLRGTDRVRLALSGDGNNVVWLPLVPEDKPVELHIGDVASGEEKRLQVQHTGIPTLSSDGRLLGVYSDGGLLLHDLKRDKEWRPLERARDVAGPVVFSADDRLLAAPLRGFAGAVGVGVWDLASSRLIAKFFGGGDVRVVVFSSQGKHLASAGEEKTVCLWDVPRR
jgi:WD40 repeat protein